MNATVLVQVQPTTITLFCLVLHTHISSRWSESARHSFPSLCSGCLHASLSAFAPKRNDRGCPLMHDLRHCSPSRTDSSLRSVTSEPDLTLSFAGISVAAVPWPPLPNIEGGVYRLSESLALSRSVSPPRSFYSWVTCSPSQWVVCFHTNS